MNKQDRSDVAKTVGDTCGSLACASIGFAVFAITLSSSISYYRVEVLSIVSIMTGIAIACFFTRFTLFSTECRDCTPDMVFKPLAKYLVIFVVLGLGLGLFVFAAYESPKQEKCYEVSIGLVAGHSEETIRECYDMRHDILQLLNGVLAGFPIIMIVWAVICMMRRISRFGNSKSTSSG